MLGSVVYRTLSLRRLQAETLFVFSIEAGLLDIYGLAILIESSSTLDILGLWLSVYIATKIGLRYAAHRACNVPLLLLALASLLSLIPGAIAAINAIERSSLELDLLRASMLFMGFAVLANALGARFALNRKRVWIALTISTIVVPSLSPLYGTSSLPRVDIFTAISMICGATMLSTAIERTLYCIDRPSFSSIVLDTGLSIVLAQILALTALSSIALASLSVATVAALLETLYEGADPRFVLFYGFRSLAVLTFMVIASSLLATFGFENVARWISIMVLALGGGSYVLCLITRK